MPSSSPSPVTPAAPAGTLQRLTGRLTLATALAAIAVRLFAGDARWAGRPGAWWAAVAMLAVVATRLAWGARDLAARRIPWTRLLLPALIAAELALFVVGRTSRGAMMRVLVAVELTLVAATLVALLLRRRRSDDSAPSEVRLAQSLTRFVPPTMARFMAFELTVVATAGSALFRRPPALRPNEHGYLRDTPIVRMPVFLLLATPADLLLTHAILPAHLVWLRWLIDAISAYSILWIFGLVAIMRRRPHRLLADALELRRGLLRRALVPLSTIERVTLRPAIDAGAELRRLGGAGWFAWTRRPLLELQLAQPVAIERLIGAPRPTTRLLVAVDEPERLEAQLRAAGPTLRIAREGDSGS